MSWEAVTWASKQRMKLPHEQLILLVLANCADPEGVAFAQWRGREHWWTYLVEKTRLSKSSLFRHINTLIDLGLCERTMIVLQDGARRPIVRLNLAAAFDIDDDESQSHGETGADDGLLDGENISDDSGLDDDFDAPPLQSHHETGPTGGNGEETSIPTGGNEPFPIVGMEEEDSKLDSKSKKAPLPPSGGAHAIDDLWDQFVRSWMDPIPRMVLARSAWDRIATERRPEALASARGYRAWLKAHPNPPTPQSAQSFLRDAAGWAQWLRYTPSGDGAPVSIVGSYRVDSPEGLAIIAAYEIGGCQQALRSFMIRNGVINYLKPITPRLRKLADAPRDRDAWVVLSYEQAGSWEGFLREVVTVQTRNRLREGSRAPWSWPPGSDGKLYPSAAGPPKAMTEQDAADFK